MAQLEATRLKRLNAKEQEEWQAISKALGDPVAQDKDALLARLGILASMTDTYDPIVTVSEASDTINIQGDVFQNVGNCGGEWRRNGKLLELGQHIQCPRRGLSWRL